MAYRNWIPPLKVMGLEADSRYKVKTFGCELERHQHFLDMFKEPFGGDTLMNFGILTPYFPFNDAVYDAFAYVIEKI